MTTMATFIAGAVVGWGACLLWRWLWDPRLAVFRESDLSWHYAEQKAALAQQATQRRKEYDRNTGGKPAA